MAKKGKKTQPTPETMPLIHPHAAGIDVGAEEHWVGVPADRDAQPLQKFSAFTCDVHRLADWLTACRMTTVGMESTGVYWIPLFQMLEARGLQVALVNARHVKHVPGRPKTDRVDCQWRQRVQSYGVLASSFRPPEDMCQLRSVLRHRDTLVPLSVKHMQHLQKSLDHMPLHLHHVMSEVTGVTGMRIIRAIVWGGTRPADLRTASGLSHASQRGHDTYMAQVAEVSVQDRQIKVHRVVVAVDLGRMVNPNIVEQQIESNIVFGLTALLYGDITLKDGRVQQTNFDTYQLLRMPETPKIEMHIVKSTEKPGGIGEPGMALLPPAVANAVYALNGQRLRTMPFRLA